MIIARYRPILLAILVALASLAPIVHATDRATAADPATITARGSVEQVSATGLDDGHRIALLDASDNTVATHTANDLGGVLFRDVTPGNGYTLKDLDGDATSDPITVHDDTAAPWDPSVYDQPIASSGYQYITTRDGTQLAAYVHPPLVASKDPVPTLIEYAGYGYADPDGPQSGLAKLANAMGFAVVDVNMRGTGCSGGAFDYFEPLQNLDAYDVIESVAKQPWVLHNQVGMFGISYGGISQLFAAQLNPPHLAAIAPLSVIDATPTTLYPGGILNTGFALSWAEGRVSDAQPATATTGEKYAYKQIQNGDTTCAANQALHPEAVNLIDKIHANTKYIPEVADPIDPVSFVDKIHVPVYMACQFQDEQTGGHCPELARHMTGTDDKWFSFTNGAHIDALDPENLNQIFDFLELFVAERAPGPDSALTKLAAPIIYRTAMGVPDSVSYTLPHDPVQDETTYDAALAKFRALPRVQVRFDNGAGADPSGVKSPGAPYAGFTAGFDSVPAAGTQTRTWYLGPDGSLTDDPSADGAVDRYTSDADALPRTNYSGNTGGGGLWADASAWKWNWLQNPAGNAASYVTGPLNADTTVFGTGSVNLWVKSSTPDVDLQVTISEVRPDGVESFVQNGWLRASARKLSTDSDNVLKRPSTDVDPIPSFTAADAEDMPADTFVPVHIPLYYQGHAYRAGSRIRVVVSAPNGSQPVWSFDDTEPSGTTADVQIAHSPSMPSSLMLPVVPGVDVPTALPDCPSLRSEPCRDYVAYSNDSTALPPDETTTTTTTTTEPESTATTTTTSTTSTTSTVPSTAPSTSGEVGPDTTAASPPTSAGPTQPSSTNGVNVVWPSGSSSPNANLPAPGASAATAQALPSTGFNPWAGVGIGLALIALGAALDNLRRSRWARRSAAANPV